METKTRSQLFPDKEYNTTIDDLEERDYNIKSELYKVRIFNKNIHIASGNIIKDEKYTTLYYCYVYVILKERVKAKLGVYEKVIDGTEIPIQFDLSLFDEGSMLVFDNYYNDTKKINEFEVADVTQEGTISIFDYLQGKMITNPKTLQKDMKRHGTRLVKIFDMIRKNKETEIEYIRMFDKFTKYFNDLVIFNEELIDFLKLPEITQFELLFVLCIVEFYFSIKFIFVNEEDDKMVLINNEKYNELRTVFNNAKYSEIIVLNVDSKQIIKTVKTNEKSNGSEELDQVLKEYTSISVSEEVTEEPVEPPEELLEEDLEDVPVETLDDSESKSKNRTLLSISNPSINTQVNVGNAEPYNEPKQSKKLTFTGSVLKPKKNEEAPLSVIPEETAAASATAALSAINTNTTTTTSKKQSKTKGPPPTADIEEEQKSSTKSAAKSKKSKGPPPSIDIEEELKSSTKSSTKSSSKTKKEAASVEPLILEPPIDEPTLDEKTKQYKASVNKLFSTVDTKKSSKSKK
jgi:hypothetical protein